MIKNRTFPVIDIPELQSELSDELLLAHALEDAIEAMARFAVKDRHIYHATLLLHDLAEQFERGNKP